MVQKKFMFDGEITVNVECMSMIVMISVRRFTMGNGECTRPKGQFSRRHQTNREHEESVIVWKQNHGVRARRAWALDRLREMLLPQNIGKAAKEFGVDWMEKRNERIRKE